MAEGQTTGSCALRPSCSLVSAQRTSAFRIGGKLSVHRGDERPERFLVSALIREIQVKWRQVGELTGTLQRSRVYRNVSANDRHRKTTRLRRGTDDKPRPSQQTERAVTWSLPCAVDRTLSAHQRKRAPLQSSYHRKRSDETFCLLILSEMILCRRIAS